MDYILFDLKDVTVVPNPDEVRHVEFVARRHFQDYLNTLKLENTPITPWFQLIVVLPLVSSLIRL